MACNGVLVHLENLEEVKKGFEECCRVVKPGGFFYVSGGTVGGILEGVIFPALREHYIKNNNFRTFIDNLNPRIFLDLFQKIGDDMYSFTKETFDKNNISHLFDEDFCVYLQNALQPPSRLHQDFHQEFIQTSYKENNFFNIKRLTRYVVRKNLRKYFAPLHYDKDYCISKILYGEGSMEFIAQKK